MSDLGVSLLTSIIGIALITGIIVTAVKKAANMTAAQQDRYLPLANLAIGTILGIIGALFVPDAFTRQTILAGAITGFFGGASAGGLYDTINGFLKPTTP